MPAGAGAVARATIVSEGENTGLARRAWARLRNLWSLRHAPGSARPGYFLAAMITVFMNASPMLSDVTSDRSVTAMCTMRRS